MSTEQNSELSSLITALANSGAEFSISPDAEENADMAATHKLSMRGKSGGTEWRLTLKADYPIFDSDLAKSMRDCDVKAGRWKFYSSYHFQNEIAELGPGESLESTLRKITRSMKTV